MQLQKHIRRLAWIWPAAALLYWWLIAKIEKQQLIAAAIVGFVVAVAMSAVATRLKLSFSPKWKWLLLLLRKLPARILQDLGLLLVILYRSIATQHRPTGAYSKIHFHPGGHDSWSSARRALVFAAVSLPPNSFAVSVEGNHSLLIHQLVSRSTPKDEDWPL